MNQLDADLLLLLLVISMRKPVKVNGEKVILLRPKEWRKIQGAVSWQQIANVINK